MNFPFIWTNVRTIERSLGPSKSRPKILKDKKDLDKLPPDSTDLYKDNYLDSVYPFRPPELEDCSVHTMLTEFTLTDKNEKTPLDDNHIQAVHNPKKIFLRRKEPYVFVCTNEASMFHDDAQKMRYIFQVLFFKLNF